MVSLVSTHKSAQNLDSESKTPTTEDSVTMEEASPFQASPEGDEEAQDLALTDTRSRQFLSDYSTRTDGGYKYRVAERDGKLVTAENFRLVAFSLINVLCFAVFEHLNIIPPQTRAFFIAGYLSYFLAGVTIIFAFKGYIKRGIRNLLRGAITRATLLSIFLLLAFGGTGYLLFESEARLLFTPLAEGLVASIFLVFLYESVVTNYLHRADELSGFWPLKVPRTYLRYEKKIGDSSTATVSSESVQAGNEDAVLDKSNASLRSVPPAVLREGDMLFLESGDVVPADGTILRGKCIVLERKLSGAAVRGFRQKGQKVWAGSTLLSGKVNVEVTARCNESVLSTFTSILDSRIAELAKRRQGNFTTINILNGLLLFSAACTFLYWSQDYGKGTASVVESSELFFVRLRAFLSALSVLAVAPLCAFLLILGRAPELMLTSLFMRGVLVVNNKVLKAFSGIKHFVMHFHPEEQDGRAHVKKFEILDQKFEKKGLLEALACLLSVSEHFTDRAIVEHAAEQLCAGALHDVSDVQVVPGYGVLGLVDGADLSVGTEGFLIERGIYVQPSDLFSEVSSQETPVYIAIYDQVIARVLIGEPLRSDAKGLREKLKSIKRRLVLCSDSSDREAVDNFGKGIGLDLAEISSDLDEKSYLRKLEMLSDVNRGSAARGGTGIALYSPEPAPKSIREKIDISFSRFDELKWETDRADVYLMDNDVQRLASILSVADNTRRVVLVLQVFGALLAGLLLIGAVTASLPPLINLLSAVIGVIFAVLLSLRLLPR